MSLALGLAAVLALHLSPLASTALPSHATASPDERPARREVLVAMRAPSVLDARAIPAALAASARAFGYVAESFASTPRADGAHTSWLRLRPGAGATLDALATARELAKVPGVIAAAPNLSMRLALTTPNDPYPPQQWHLSTSSAAIRARLAWDTQRGDSSVSIAIMDTGVDRGHPDLAAKIWRNTGEIAGNGIDDDGNGRVDDVNGWDFGDGDADPDPVPFLDPLVGIDVGWHGTFCAGLAGAASNNGQGIAGMAWGSKIMPLKVSDTTGDIPLSAVTEAFAYAIHEHASVISLSFGSSDTSSRAFFQALVNDAVAGNVVCVAAAGNDGTDFPFYPAACESVLAVAATTPSNQRADFSNWGDYVDIAAPGAEVWSSISRNYEYDEVTQIFFEVLWLWDGVNPYMQNDGTSFSCPITAGAAALVRSQFPSLTHIEVIQQIVTRGDVVITYDNPIGPRLNVLRAVTEPLLATPVPPPSAVLALTAGPNPFAGATVLRLGLPRDADVRVEVFDATGRRVRSLAAEHRAAGRHAFTWDGRDDAGRGVHAGLYFAAVRAGGAFASVRIARVE